MVHVPDVIRNLTTLDRPTLPAQSSRPQLFKVSQYLPSDDFSPLSGVPRMSKSEMENKLKELDEQINALTVAARQQVAKAKLYSVETASMKAGFEWAKGQLKRAEYQSELNFLADKLNNKNTAHKELLGIDKQTWDVKIDSAQAKLQHEQRKLQLDQQLYPQLESIHQQKNNNRLAKAQEALQRAIGEADSAAAFANTIEAEILG